MSKGRGGNAIARIAKVKAPAVTPKKPQLVRKITVRAIGRGK